jgi:DNA-binding MarR family transcriptional regulator
MHPSEKFKDLHFDGVTPSDLLLNPDIESSAKVFYAIVRNLTKVVGYCYAKNKYLAELMCVDVSTIKRWLCVLERAGYIDVQFESHRFGTKRKIFVVDSSEKSLQELENEPISQEHPAHVSSLHPLIEKEDIKKKEIEESSPPPSSSPVPKAEPSKQEIRSSLHPAHVSSLHPLIEKEDIKKKEIEESSPPPSSSPVPKAETSKGEIRMMIFSCTDEEFEEAYKKYRKYPPGKILSPKHWFEAVIANERSRKASGDEERIQRHRKQAEELERRYPPSDTVDRYIKCLKEYVELKFLKACRIVYFNISDELWREQTGWA